MINSFFNWINMKTVIITTKNLQSYNSKEQKKNALRSGIYKEYTLRKWNVFPCSYFFERSKLDSFVLALEPNNFLATVMEFAYLLHKWCAINK